NSTHTETDPDDAIAPVIDTLMIPITGWHLLATFVEAASPPLLPATSITGFSVDTDDNESLSIIYAERTADTAITLTLSRMVYHTETVTLSYAGGYAGGNVTDSASPPNVMALFSDAAVVNNSAYGDPFTLALSDDSYNLLVGE